MKLDDGTADEFETRLVDHHFHAVFLEDPIRFRIHFHRQFELVLKTGTTASFDDDAETLLADLLEAFDARIGDDQSVFVVDGWERRGRRKRR